MEDAEYPAYLKRQSYDDLVSISCSIDKVAQAKRYELVSAELAERDKRGEKPRQNWHSKSAMAVAFIFVFRFGADLVSSATGWRPIMHLLIGLVCLIIAWVTRKKGKNERPTT